MAPAVGRFFDLGTRNDDGLGNVDDDAHLIGGGKPAAQCLDETDGFVARQRWQGELDARHLDNDAVGIGEREHLELHGLVEADDEPGAARIDGGCGFGFCRR